MSGDRAPRFYVIPAGTRPSQCNGSTCRGVIYWIDDGNRRVPVDADVSGGETPSDTNDKAQRDIFKGTADVYDGRGVHHSTVCPDRDEFARGRT